MLECTIGKLETRWCDVRGGSRLKNAKPVSIVPRSAPVSLSDRCDASRAARSSAVLDFLRALQKASSLQIDVNCAAVDADIARGAARMAAVFPCLSVAGIAHTSAGYLRFVRPLLAPSNNDWYPSDGSSGAALFVKAAILIHRAAYIAGRHAASTTVLTRCSAACRRRWRRIPITRRALVTACAAMLSTLTRHADLGQDTTNMSTSCRLHVQNGGVRSRETSDVVVRAGSLAQDTRVRGLKVVERQTTLLPCDWTKVVREAFKPLGNTLGTSESSRESGDVADSGPILTSLVSRRVNGSAKRCLPLLCFGRARTSPIGAGEVLF
ncbi:hypothetical protein EV715DRAFT_268087 [Schizophyllum commune]